MEERNRTGSALSAPVGVVADLESDVVSDFLRAAETWPDRTAIVHNGESFSYRELAERVRRTARQFRAHQQRNDGLTGRIGLLVSHHPQVVEHLIGVLQAGATFCPIDVSLPTARKQSLAGVLGLDRAFAVGPTPLQNNDFRVEILDDAHRADNGAADLDAESPTEPAWTPEQPAYVLCTSGSTGTPKPVVVSRRALTTTVQGLRDLFGVTPSDRVLQFASLAWDTCLEEILPTLTSGAALVFDSVAYSGSFPAFVRMLSERGVTVLDLPTAYWHELVLFLHEEQTALPECVRLVVIGGERVDPTRLQQWHQLDFAHVELLNTYGCTETTLITHAMQLAGPGTEPLVTLPGSEVPIGRPLPHIVDHVTDDGELLIAGPTLASEYLGMENVTAAAFPVEDHGAGPARYFHTGDVVTRGPDGVLYSRGRADEQVKVLGVRVHPAEVEAQLNSHPAVAGAVVLGERSLERTVLAAYVVVAREVTARDLKQFIRERLPNQFVPSRITFVTALSYTSSGKVDRLGTRRAATERTEKENI